MRRSRVELERAALEVAVRRVVRDAVLPVVEGGRVGQTERGGSRRAVGHRCYVFIPVAPAVGARSDQHEEGRRRGMVCTRWIMDFEVLWRWIMGSTGGRALQFVLGGTVVDSTSLRGAKWPRFLSRSQAKACTESSPLVVTVVLRGWS